MSGERQLAQLHQVISDYPNMVPLTEEFRDMRGRELSWPDWCFLPMGAAYTIVANRYGRDTAPLDSVADVARVAALNTWRYTRGIYRFHPTLADALARSPIDGEMPAEVFLRLPEWCVYVELSAPAGGLAGPFLHGFYAHLEHDLNDGHPELRLLLDEGDQLLGLPLYIGPWPLIEAVDRAIQETTKQAGLHHVPLPDVPIGPATLDLTSRLTGIVSLLLYLCSDNPEINNPARPGNKPSRPRPTKTKKGWKLFQPNQVTVWDVGSQLGEEMHHDVGAGFWDGRQEGDRYRYRWLSTAGGL